MRGLLGDATEEFVETLSQTNAETVDDEQVYRMANVLADCGKEYFLLLYYFKFISILKKNFEVLTVYMSLLVLKCLLCQCSLAAA